ncbi:hypothetical protein B9Z55_015844 [Caenorhabditis nigoni]|nr:hypothetical protein B9Z55_015844 [Caenorhabditis nigoni]
MSRHPTTLQDCRYFANGICSKGNACTFRHDETARSENICQFHLAGKCSFGGACRFKHTARPRNTNMDRPSSSSTVSPATVLPRVRPVQLPKPSGFNAEAPAFVPSWLKNTSSGSAPMSYAAAANANSAHLNGPSTSSAAGARNPQNMMCPYNEKSGNCNRKDLDCPFTHGDLCDMCHLWCLHPYDEELKMKHLQECTTNHQAEMERAFLMQESETKSCGICMEMILEKNMRFGILNGCQHCFCLECIREWRSRDQRDAGMATKVVRSCPECRQHSDYVIPSLFWVEKGQEKEVLISMYKDNMKSKICKYYSNNKEAGFCKFGNKCFYKHQLPDGSIDPGEDPHVRRRARLADFIFPDDETDTDSDASDSDGTFNWGDDDDDEWMDQIDNGPFQYEAQFYRAIASMVREMRELGGEGGGEARATSRGSQNRTNTQ